MNLSLMIKPVSGTCDMRCRYCFYADVAAHRETRSMGIMTRGTMVNLVRRAFAYADNGWISFAFQGGEPLLAGIEFYREFVAEVSSRNARGLRVIFSLQTNGLSMTPEFAQFFAENHFLIGLSLDGTRDTHNKYRVDAQGNGTFDRVENAARLLKEAGCEFNILTVVSADVASHAYMVFEALKPYKYLQFMPLIDGFDAPKSEFSLTPRAYGEFLIKIFDRYEQAWRSNAPVSIRLFDNWLQMLMGYPAEHCGLMGRCGVYYLIEADGSVYPCDFYVLDEWRMGNINTEAFGKLASGAVQRRFIEMSTASAPECLPCPWYSICRGGCRRDREPFAGERFSLNRFCESYKMFFSARLDRMLNIARELRVPNS